MTKFLLTSLLIRFKSLYVIINIDINRKSCIVTNMGHNCENCGLTEWQKQPIVLEVHHEDGDRTNNDFSNLKLLCCNCHALTNNWRNKNKNK